MLEKHISQLEGQKLSMEALLLDLESCTSTKQVMETMSMASASQKQYLKETESFDSVLQEINEQREEMDQLNVMFKNLSLQDQDDESLLKELEQLSDPTAASEQSDIQNWIKQQNELMDRPLPKPSAQAQEDHRLH